MVFERLYTQLKISKTDNKQTLKQFSQFTMDEKRISDLQEVVEANKAYVIRMKEKLRTMSDTAQEMEETMITDCNYYTELIEELITALKGGNISEIDTADKRIDSWIKVKKV